MVYGRYFDTALGRLYAAAEDGYIIRLTEGSANADDVSLEEIGNTAPDAGKNLALLERAIEEIREYTEGKRQVFDLPAKTNGTVFQEKVWAILKRIPYGETRTYGSIAAEAGSPGGARAVGMACNRNPILLIIPCHRVVGSGGALVGFAGGLPMKAHLLELESNVSAESKALPESKAAPEAKMRR